MKIFNAIKTKEKFDKEELEELKKNMTSKYITYLDENYPECFKNIHCPPLVLYYIGNINILNAKNRVAIVGSRDASIYGLEMTKKLTREFVDKNYIIVSGLARGVDAMAHKTCIDNNGLTIGVVANGCDIKYPPSNSELYDQIIEHNGLIISEYPDGLPAEPNKFSHRNRLISALGNFLVVTEAYSKSGTMLTVKNALYQGKDVYCVPYLATDDSICNAFIKQGAYLIENSDDVLEKL